MTQISNFSVPSQPTMASLYIVPIGTSLNKILFCMLNKAAFFYFLMKSLAETKTKMFIPINTSFTRKEGC